MGTKKGTGTAPRKRRRIRAKDKLSVTEHATDDDDWRAFIEPVEGAFAGVAWTLRTIEKRWEDHASPESVGEPESHSRAWYADQILTWITRARAAFVEQDIEAFGMFMHHATRLHEEGRWRLAFAPTERYMRKVRAKNLRAGRRRGREVQANAQDRDHELIGLAGKLRDKHPRDAQHSTRWLANEIGRRTHQKFETVRARLKRLGLT